MPMAADSLFVRTPYPADDPAIGLVHNLETEFLVKKIKRERKYKRYVITIEGLKYGRTYRVYSAEPELKDQYRNFEKIKKGQKYRMSIGVLFPPLLNGHWLTFFSPHYKTELENVKYIIMEQVRDIIVPILWACTTSLPILLLLMRV